MENKKIGSAIQYFRESYNISQSTLGKGLCSVATLSRIEAGERDVDSLLLETLLERLGKTPNQFELILSDVDYMLYQNRENIKKNINDKNYNDAYATLKTYEKIAASKGSVHMQFIVTCKAYLNELNDGNIEKTIDLLMEAISYTIPDFKTNKIKNYYLSYSELNIIIDMVEHMLSAGMFQKADAILNQVVDYLDSYKSMEVSNQLYPRVAVIASKLLFQNNNWDKAVDMCSKGLEKNKGSRRMDYVGELYYIKAKSTEELLNRQLIKCDKSVIIKMYLQAYYMFNLCETYDEAYIIKKHLKEEYQWEDID
jgi:transcriptional regulator with XRE-family HTH domain